MFTADFATVLAHTDHPYLRVAPAMDFRWAVLDSEASSASVFDTDSGVPWLLALGDQLDEVTAIAAAQIGSASRWTVPRAHEHLLGAERSQWDWWGRTADTPLPRLEHEVDRLGTVHHGEITALLALASPTASSAPDDPEVCTWHGIRSNGSLVAVGAGLRWKSGAPNLASIATHPEYRGRGLARSITTSLTRFFFDQGQSQVFLGMYAANDSARRTYTAVGYRVLQEFSSGAPKN